ncbi:MAG: hypothetical protein U9P42_11030 [Candidatus Fermentibacteria bacterium]|nr:hypothetical protein [Candidatus Fermentibacteria bacterium]
MKETSFPGAEIPGKRKLVGVFRGIGLSSMGEYQVLRIKILKEAV